MTDLPFGTVPWFRSASLFGILGILDCTLRLMEQEEISRAKAREVLEAAVLCRLGLPYDHPRVDWSKLNFYEAALGADDD